VAFCGSNYLIYVVYSKTLQNYSNGEIKWKKQIERNPNPKFSPLNAIDMEP
jgi:hypothetical protein